MKQNSSSSVITPHVDPACKGIGLIARIRKDPLKFFLDLGNKNGSYTWLSLMGSPVLFLNDATAIEYVFGPSYQNYHKGKYNDGLRPLLGNSIFLSEDPLWHRQRRELAPNFSGGHFPAFARRIGDAADALVKRLGVHARDGTPVDIGAEMTKMTLDAVLRALFHEDSENAQQQMRIYLGTMLRFAEQRIWSAANLPLWLALKLPRQKKALRILDALTADFIQRRRKNKEYPEDLLSRLLETHGDTPQDRKLLRDSVLAFLVAGHETTANGLTWTFYELGRHQDIKGSIVAEIDEIAGQETPDMETMKKMHLTRQAFFEGLRLYPPIWTTSRCALVDDMLPLDDGRKMLVPKGATLMLCTYSVHRRATYWQDPGSFMPERFSYEEIAKRPRLSWFPFGGGPRLCLGFKFAEIESIITLTKIYQNFDLTLMPDQNIKPDPIITLRPNGPVWFKVTSRK